MLWMYHRFITTFRYIILHVMAIIKCLRAISDLTAEAFTPEVIQGSMSEAILISSTIRLTSCPQRTTSVILVHFIALESNGVTAHSSL